MSSYAIKAFVRLIFQYQLCDIRHEACLKQRVFDDKLLYRALEISSWGWMMVES